MDKKKQLKNKLLRYLRLQKVIVNFTKKNGKNRMMSCTNNYQIIIDSYPEYVPPARTVIRDDDIIVVWDLDKNDWRCFGFSQVKSFEANKICWEC